MTLTTSQRLYVPPLRGDGLRPPGSGPSRTIRLPYALHAVPLARHTLVADLRARRVPTEVIEESESIVAELVGNAIRHAVSLPDGTLRLHWQARDGVVELEVTDGGGPTRPRALQHGVLSVSGRGLRIVRAMAHEWGVVEAPPGHTVWASVGGPSRRRRH
jgi:serine/threonine-protein kinase RsbW